MDTFEVADDERVTRLGVISRPLGQAQVPLAVVAERVLGEIRVLVDWLDGCASSQSLSAT